MVRRPLALALAVIAALTIGAAPAAASTDASGSTGAVRFVKRMTPSDDQYVTGKDATTQAWLNSKYWRSEVFAPFFDQATSWYTKGWVYSDIYAIYTSSALATQHPDWILKDPAGNKLFIPWGCSNGTCPQYAADITNPDYRADWIAKLKGTLAKGYRGAWIDDVNLELRVGNGAGADVLPYSASLGRQMTAADWRKAMADFTVQIRSAIPDKELLHNSIWYAAQGAGREKNADVQRQIASADYINLERGVTDGGLTGGTGEWSLRAVQAYADQVHAQGKGLIIDSWEQDDSAREYSLANYLLINTGRDGVGDMSQTPNSWWKGWDTNLGTATTGRYDWQGLMRRDFTGGIALVNEPQAPTRTVVLPTAMTTIDGRTVTSVTLAAGKGAVLFGTVSTPVVTPAPTTPPACSCAPTTPVVTPAPTPATTPTPLPTATPKPAPTPKPGKPRKPTTESTTTGSTGSTGSTTTGSTTTGSTTTPAGSTKGCTTVKVTYPTLRWSSKVGRLVSAKGSAKVCISSDLVAGTPAHTAALKQAKTTARRASIAKAKSARRLAVRASAARA